MNYKRLQSGSEDSDEESAEESVGDDRRANVKKRKIHLRGINGSDSGKEEKEASHRKKITLDSSLSINENFNYSVSSKVSPKTKEKAKDGDLKYSTKTSDSDNPTERLIMRTLFEESEESECKTESSGSEAEKQEKSGCGSSGKIDKKSRKTSKERAYLSSQREDSEGTNDEGSFSDRNSRNVCRDQASIGSDCDEKPLNVIIEENRKGKSLVCSKTSDSIIRKRKRSNEGLSGSSENEIRETKNKLVTERYKSTVNTPLKEIIVEDVDLHKLSRKSVVKSIKYDTSCCEEDGEVIRRKDDEKTELSNFASERDEEKKGSTDSEQSSVNEGKELTMIGKIGKERHLAKNKKLESFNSQKKLHSIGNSINKEKKSRKNKLSASDTSNDEDYSDSRRLKLKSGKSNKEEGESQSSGSSSVEAEISQPLKSKSGENKKRKTKTPESNSSSNEADDSDTRPLKPKSGKSNKGRGEFPSSDSSSDEAEISQPLKSKSDENKKRKTKTPATHFQKSNSFSDATSDSDMQPLKLKSDKSDKEKPKIHNSDSSSDGADTWPLKQKSGKKGKSKPPASHSDEAEDSGSQPLKPESNADSKRPTAGEKKLLRMKRFLLTAGIRISNYNNFFIGCKSTTAKVKKLQDLLEEKGLKGRPTIEKCKKLRKKLETQREIAELDMGNIIEGGTRSRRGRNEPKEKVNERKEICNFKQRFSRIKDFVSSDSG